jgi:uncharacterized protein (DUF885 family)
VATDLGDRRYVVWPGQALAYKVGQLALRRLRDEAQAEDFDFRSWRTFVLGGGEMPLALLEASQRRWLSGSQGRP